MSGAETPAVDDDGSEAAIDTDTAVRSPSDPEVETVDTGDGGEQHGNDAAASGSTVDDLKVGSDEASDDSSSPTNVEELIEVTETVTAERDQYLEMLQRSQAEFENYKRRVNNQQSDIVARAAESLVEQLLPVLDAFDGAMAHDTAGVEPLFNMFLDALSKQGLERIDDVDETFDPNQHDAVLHEPGDGASDGPTVIEVMRPGYRWNSRVLRPAMVKVQG